ncbi:MAG: hypothetical protein ACOYYS_19635 [Chloroflexota bacterium]
MNNHPRYRGFIAKTYSDTCTKSIHIDRVSLFVIALRVWLSEPITQITYVFGNFGVEIAKSEKKSLSCQVGHLITLMKNLQSQMNATSTALTIQEKESFDNRNIVMFLGNWIELISSVGSSLDALEISSANDFSVIKKILVNQLNFLQADMLEVLKIIETLPDTKS